VLLLLVFTLFVPVCTIVNNNNDDNENITCELYVSLILSAV